MEQSEPRHPPLPDTPIAALIRTLHHHRPLEAGEIQALLDLPIRLKAYDRGAAIVEPGPTPSDSCFIVSGFGAREAILDDGARQISSLHVRGDFCDIHAFVLSYMDHRIVALTPLTMAFVQHRDIRALLEKWPSLERLFWQITATDGAVHRVWMASIGRRPGPERVAHLFCEIATRLSVQGLVEDDSFDFGVSQGALGDMVGLSLVHTNRSLKPLRESGLIRWASRRLTLLRPAELRAMCGFDPTYLNLRIAPSP